MTIARDMTKALEDLRDRDPWPTDAAPRWEMGMPAFEALCRFAGIDQIDTGGPSPRFLGCVICITTKFDGWELIEHVG